MYVIRKILKIWSSISSEMWDHRLKRFFLPLCLIFSISASVMQRSSSISSCIGSKPLPEGSGEGVFSRWSGFSVGFFVIFFGDTTEVLGVFFLILLLLFAFVFLEISFCFSGSVCVEMVHFLTGTEAIAAKEREKVGALRILYFFLASR